MKTQSTMMLVVAATLFGSLSVRAAEAPRPVDASAVADRADQILRHTQQALENVAAEPEVRSATWDAMKEKLGNLQSDLKGVVWFALPDGSYYTVEKNLVPQKINDRPYFSRVMAGEISVGEVVTSKSTGRPVVVAVVPVKSQDKVVGAVGASLYLDELSKAIDAGIQLPRGASFLAVNRAGKVVLDRDVAAIMTDYPVASGDNPATSSLTGWKFLVIGR